MIFGSFFLLRKLLFISLNNLISIQRVHKLKFYIIIIIEYLEINSIYYTDRLKLYYNENLNKQ